ncbi:hypothetical protein HMPREF9151_00977 [Hoylesella saccharolytica F0055]|uniref:Uncharacterized protein n=1 Tax=Hoylesella saccharolytica F0055 TaxID=1127699 RepID=L1NEB0_9BACT|nr:hypothetical protein HMPREF9151_00977 [Hoylesella saccharolytica F0055]
MLHFYKPSIHLKEKPLCIFVQSLFITKKMLFVSAIYLYLLQQSNSTHLNKEIGVLNYLPFALYLPPASFHLFTFSLLLSYL